MREDVNGTNVAIGGQHRRHAGDAVLARMDQMHLGVDAGQQPRVIGDAGINERHFVRHVFQRARA